MPKRTPPGRRSWRLCASAWAASCAKRRSASARGALGADRAYVGHPRQQPQRALDADAVERRQPLAAERRSRAVAERVRGAEAEDAAWPVLLVPVIQGRQHDRRLLALVRVEQLHLDVHRRPILGLARQYLIPLFGELLHWRPS